MLECSPSVVWVSQGGGGMKIVGEGLGEVYLSGTRQECTSDLIIQDFTFYFKDQEEIDHAIKWPFWESERKFLRVCDSSFFLFPGSHRWVLQLASPASLSQAYLDGFCLFKRC